MIMMPSVQLTDRLYNDSYLQGSFLVADICYTDTPDTLCVSCVSSRTDHSLDTRTQCDLHNGTDNSVDYQPDWLGFRCGVFTCVGWQVALCDPIP